MTAEEKLKELYKRLEEGELEADELWREKGIGLRDASVMAHLLPADIDLIANLVVERLKKKGD